MHMSGLLVRREDCNHVPGLPIAAPTAAGSHPLPRKCTVCTVQVQAESIPTILRAGSPEFSYGPLP